MGTTGGEARSEASTQGSAGEDRRHIRVSTAASGLSDTQAGRLRMSALEDRSAQMFREQRLRDVTRHHRMETEFGYAFEEAKRANDEPLAMAVVHALRGLAIAMERTP